MFKKKKYNNYVEDNPDFVRFGELPEGSRFIFKELEFVKIEECYGRIVKSGKRVEFGRNMRVLPL